MTDQRKSTSRREGQPASFPYANWGPWIALLGVPLALVMGAVIGAPGLLFGVGPNGLSSTAGRVITQFGAELGFLAAPALIAVRRGAAFPQEVLSRLGVRRFKRSALLWMALALVAYFAAALLYGLLVKPTQEDIAKQLGPVSFQILLIVFVAPACEEVCFRGMLFGGLRTKLPRIGAASVSALVFAALHAPEGISIVPPLIFFGFVLALLYERTGSIVPGILLHMLNNSIALIGQ